MLSFIKYLKYVDTIMPSFKNIHMRCFCGQRVNQSYITGKCFFMCVVCLCTHRSTYNGDCVRFGVRNLFFKVLTRRLIFLSRAVSCLCGNQSEIVLADKGCSGLLLSFSNRVAIKVKQSFSLSVCKIPLSNSLGLASPLWEHW